MHIYIIVWLIYGKNLSSLLLEKVLIVWYGLRLYYIYLCF